MKKNTLKRTTNIQFGQDSCPRDGRLFPNFSENISKIVSFLFWTNSNRWNLQQSLANCSI